MSSPDLSGHRPQLDSLRTFAVAGVMLAHFAPGSVGAWANTGAAGVRLFFVLSGFLITGILLRARDRLGQTTSTAGNELRAFFLRRSLRIFPLYYAVIAIACLFAISDVRSHAGWLLTYTYNFRVWLTGVWNPLTAHFWTLAAEEQFYLLWPWLILFVPARWLPWVIGSFVPSALLFRCASDAGWLGPRLGQYVLLPSNWDLLAAGGMLAWWGHAEMLDRPVIRRWLAVAGWVGLAGLLWHNHIWRLAPHPPWPLWWENTTDALLFGVIVLACARGVGGSAGRVLSLPVLTYLGRISYGIYVYHNFMHDLGPRLSHRLFGIRYFSTEWGHVAWLSACTLACAIASYHLFEQPILRWRDRLPSPAKPTP